MKCHALIDTRAGASFASSTLIDGINKKPIRKQYKRIDTIIRGGSRATATSKVERFVIIVNEFQPLTIITKRSILVVTAALDLPLIISS